MKKMILVTLALLVTTVGCASYVAPDEADPETTGSTQESIVRDRALRFPFRANRDSPAILARSLHAREKYVLATFPDRAAMAEWRIQHRQDYEILMMVGFEP